MNEETWLIKEKKILKQKPKRGAPPAPIKFQFKFQFYPENVTEEIIQDLTLRLLFKQVCIKLLE